MMDSHDSNNFKQHEFLRSPLSIEESGPDYTKYLGIILAAAMLAVAVPLLRESVLKPLGAMAMTTTDQVMSSFSSRAADKLPLRVYDPDTDPDLVKPEKLAAHDAPLYLTRGSFSKARTVTLAPSSGKKARARLNRPKCKKKAQSRSYKKAKCKGRKGITCHKRLRATGVRSGCKRSFLRR